MSRPPCWPAGQPCPNDCASALYARQVHGIQPLHGPWDGWRLAGRDLVGPDGDRISPERLRGLLWRQQTEARRDALRARRTSCSEPLVTVLRVRRSDWHADSFGVAAG